MRLAVTGLRPSLAAERIVQVRQGFRHRRENCQRNDRRVVHALARGRGDFRRAEGSLRLEQRVRTSGNRIYTPGCAPAAGSHGSIDRFAS